MWQPSREAAAWQTSREGIGQLAYCLRNYIICYQSEISPIVTKQRFRNK
jgi:hypothetical protein